MNPRLFVDLDPRTLHLPPSRSAGADPVKFQRQVSRFASRTNGMPPIEISRGTDGEFMICDGVTKATRIAQLLPGITIRAEVIEDLTITVGHLPTVGDLIP